jgi:hypothetical protein
MNSRLAALTLVLAVLALPVQAQSLEDAARQAARQHDARVISARTDHSGSRPVHIIKLVTREGVVKTVRVPDRRPQKRKEKR